MDKLMVASSPVEIEAESEEAGLSRPQRDVALALFHNLTDRVGQAGRLLHDDAGFPLRRFYFGPSDHAEMASLLAGLRDREDFAEVVAEVPQDAPGPNGLFAQQSQDGFTGVLVG